MSIGTKVREILLHKQTACPPNMDLTALYSCSKGGRIPFLLLLLLGTILLILQ